MNRQAIDWDRWERLLAYLGLAITPLIITPATVDSYLLGKLVWVVAWGAVWLAIIGARISWQQWRPTSVDWPLAFMLIVYTASVMLSDWAPHQFKALIHLFIFFAIFYAFFRQWRRGLSPVRIGWLLTAVAVFLAVYGLLQDYGIDFSEKMGGVRDWRSQVVATLGNPNFLGGYLAYSLPLAVGLGLRKAARFHERLLAGLAILLIVACLTLTFCVGCAMGLASLAIILPFTGWFTLRKASGLRLGFSKAWALIYLFLALFAFGWYILPNPYNSHGGSLYVEAAQSPQWIGGVGAREFNWVTTRLMIDDHPLTGIGYANYLSRHLHYQGINYQRFGDVHDRDYVIPVDQPHFLLLESAAETGPLGVLALCWLACAWTASAWRRMRRGEDNAWFLWAAYAGVWTGLIHSFASFPFHLPANTLLLVALASYCVLGRENKLTVGKAPAWRIGLLAGFVLLIGTLSFAEYHSNRLLRLGSEAQGLRSLVLLQQARWWNPFDAQVHFMLGVRYIEAGWDDNAIRALNRTIELQEKHKAHEYLARLYERRGELDKAIAEQRRVIELNPIYAGHYRDLANLFESAGHTQEAQEARERAAQLEAAARKKYGEDPAG